jgi:hypothetical protein
MDPQLIERDATGVCLDEQTLKPYADQSIYMCPPLATGESQTGFYFRREHTDREDEFMPFFENPPTTGSEDVRCTTTQNFDKNKKNDKKLVCCCYGRSVTGMTLGCQAKLNWCFDRYREADNRYKKTMNCINAYIPDDCFTPTCRGCLEEYDEKQNKEKVLCFRDRKCLTIHSGHVPEAGDENCDMDGVCEKGENQFLCPWDCA